MELTEVEKRLINHYRNGGDVKVNHWHEGSYETGIKKIDNTRVRWIHNIGGNTPVFVGYDEDIQISLFLK